MSLKKLTGLAVSAAMLTACGGTMEDPQPANQQGGDSYEIVTPGKADNYYSNVAKEFELTGTIDVEMTEEEYTDETERTHLVSQRLTAVGLYLTTYLTDKFRGIDSDDSGEIEEDEVFFENDDYGGFKAMVRNHSVETVDVSEADQGSYAVDFTIDVAGPKQLPELLLEEGGQHAEGGVAFEVQMPKGAKSDRDSAGSGTIRDFDPSSYDGELESVELVATPQPKIRDAYPHYNAFMEDGVYDITLFYGYDYNESRSDLQGAEDAFTTLRRKGFETPASSFESLDYDSGPFVKEVSRLSANGPEQVEIEVRVFHADMFKGERSRQTEMAISELTSRDIFFYNGHAGPYYGFYLDPDNDAFINYTEIEAFDFEQDRQQLFIAQGCQTYSQYADMLYANPAKSEQNLDVITTVNYSYGRGTMTLLKNLINVDGENHRPVSFYDIVEDLNSEFYNRYKDVFYGVMGIDGNPQVHPYANTEAIGASCEADADCGGSPEANVCVEGSCAVRTLAEGSCPTGSSFGYLGQGSSVDGGVCY